MRCLGSNNKQAKTRGQIPPCSAIHSIQAFNGLDDGQAHKRQAIYFTESTDSNATIHKPTHRHTQK